MPLASRSGQRRDWALRRRGSSSSKAEQFAVLAERVAEMRGDVRIFVSARPAGAKGPATGACPYNQPLRTMHD